MPSVVMCSMTKDHFEQKFLKPASFMVRLFL